MPSRRAGQKPVFFERGCFLGIVMAAMEVYSRETTGLLIGRNAKRFIGGKLTDCVVLGEAYPLQTAKRRFSFVMLGSKRALDRARQTASAFGFYVLGEFHSHTNRAAVLTASDKMYIRKEIIETKASELELVGNRWLEVVVGITKRVYKRPQRTGWFPSASIGGKGVIKGILRPRSMVGFEIKIRAYWVGMRMIKEAQIFYSAN